MVDQNRDSLHRMKWGNWLIGSCCALFVAIIIVPTGAYPGIWQLMSGANAPAWAQFAGGLAAVAAAIWAAWKASDQATKTAKLEAVRLIELPIGIAYQITDLALECWNSMAANAPLRGQNIQGVMRLYEDYPFDRYPSAQMALTLANIHRVGSAYFGNYIAIVEKSVADSGSTERLSAPASDLIETSKLLDIISTNYDALLDHAQALLDAQPGKRVLIPLGSLKLHHKSAARPRLKAEV